jgi:glycosyltransferase involved in cell wall biosynthesis
MTTHPVTAVIINFQTPDLTRLAVQSLRRFYPALPLLLIDNGSSDGSPDILREIIVATGGPVELLLNRSNRHHGPAMDQALHYLSTDFVLFMDSDCEMVAEGVIERMTEALRADPNNYAAGKRIFMNRRGFDVQEHPGAFPVLRPMCLEVRRETYLALPPFERHGAPCLKNMRGAVERGYGLVHVPVEEYVRHKGRGTASRFGYRLGWKGKMNHLFNRLGL